MPKRLKQKIKEEKKLLRAKTKEGWRLQKQKPLEVSIREALGKLVQNTSLHDVSKLVTIIALTPIVKTIIDTSEELRTQAEYFLSGGILTGKKWEEFREDKLGWLGPDWQIWLLSFALAFLIVEHFGDIMHAAGNIFSSLKMLVTGLMVGA